MDKNKPYEAMMSKIEKLSTSASHADKSEDAMRFSQSALNLANAMRAMQFASQSADIGEAACGDTAK